MRFGIIFLCISISSLQATPTQELSQLLERRENKEAIALAKQYLSKTSGVEKSTLQKQLAIAYARDQQIESAFEIFLASLKGARKEPALAPTAEEQRLYKDALESYLSHQGPYATIGAKQIEADYAPYLKSNPQYYLLGFIVAAANANLSQFDSFFPMFYESYERYPDHYLSYKTQALLNLKLWQRGRIPAERDSLREQVRHFTELAIGANPQDSSLYRMAISFSNDVEKSRVVAVCLNNIVKDNIIIPREDLLYFVQAALSTGQRDLAQELVNSARDWYSRSRAVDHAQKLVDAQT